MKRVTRGHFPTFEKAKAFAQALHHGPSEPVTFQVRRVKDGFKVVERKEG